MFTELINILIIKHIIIDIDNLFVLMPRTVNGNNGFSLI